MYVYISYKTARVGGEGGQPEFFRFMPIFSDPPGIPKIGIGKNRKKLKNDQK